MSKMQTAVARGGVGVRQPTQQRAAAAQRTTPQAARPRTASRVRDPMKEAISAVMRVRIMWGALLVNTFVIPGLILFIAATYDVVPWKASIGPFIIALGAISICLSFPFADRYRKANTDINQEVERYRRYNRAEGQKMMKLLFIGAICAEVPSIAGMLHFFATSEIIASMLLCAPAIALMMVAYHPISANPNRRQLPQNGAEGEPAKQS